MSIKKNPDRQYAAYIQKAIKKNGGYCLSKFERSDTTRCICKEFKEQTDGMCACGLYIKDGE